MEASSEPGKEPSQGGEALQHKRSRRGLWIAVAVIVVVVLTVAYVVLSGVLNPTQAQTLSGAGSTFVAPLMTTWTQAYANITGAPSFSTKVSYQAVGSGTGIADLNNKVVDFGATDAPLQPKDHISNPNLANGTVLTIPESIGAVTFAYNLPGYPSGMNLTGALLTKIYLGNITRWNDPALVAINPGLSAPAFNQTIVVVERSDSSGTSFVWTSFLHKSDPTNWTSGLVGKSINWPTGVKKPQNAGVAGYITATAGACGYVELAYSILNSIKVAAVKNPAGDYIMPTLNSTSAAAAGAAGSLPTGIGNWANVSILDAPGATSYPIATFTYLLVYKELNTLGSSETLARAQALVNFLWWTVHGGQTYAPALAYVPLPTAVQTIDETSINSMTFNGQALVHS